MLAATVDDELLHPITAPANLRLYVGKGYANSLIQVVLDLRIFINGVTKMNEPKRSLIKILRLQYLDVMYPELLGVSYPDNIIFQ